MTDWPTPDYSRNEVNRAGRTLCDDSKNAVATRILSNWRSCHGYPINTFQATLRRKLYGIDRDAIVSQRLKRTPSIISKLERSPKMQLARMHDIGGLRAVVSDLSMLDQLRRAYKNSCFRHEFVREYDYIEQPKTSGYRSIHLVYRYRSPRVPDYDNLLLELQFRTRLQHAWATAVETMGMVTNSALKSSEGPREWLDFFALTSSAFARMEGCAPVPAYKQLSESETKIEVTRTASELDARTVLQGYAIAIQTIKEKINAGHYYLIVLELDKGRVSISSYAKSHLDKASEDYTKQEQRSLQGVNLQVVLVSTNTLSNLRRAYPSFFLDTREFIGNLNRITHPQ